MKIQDLKNVKTENIKGIVPPLLILSSIGLFVYYVVDTRRKNKLNYYILQKINEDYSGENTLIPHNIEESQLINRDCSKLVKKPVVIDLIKKLRNILSYMSYIPYTYNADSLISDFEMSGIYLYSDFYCLNKKFYELYGISIEKTFSNPIKYIGFIELWDANDANKFKMWINTIKKRYKIGIFYNYDDVNSTSYKVANKIYQTIKNKNKYTDEDIKNIVKFISELKYKEQFPMTRVILDRFLRKDGIDIKEYERRINEANKFYKQQVDNLYNMKPSIRKKYKNLDKQEIEEDGIKIKKII